LGFTLFSPTYGFGAACLGNRKHGNEYVWVGLRCA
jgi:hypothetical protein